MTPIKENTIGDLKKKCWRKNHGAVNATAWTAMLRS